MTGDPRTIVTPKKREMKKDVSHLGLCSLLSSSMAVAGCGHLATSSRPSGSTSASMSATGASPASTVASLSVSSLPSPPSVSLAAPGSIVWARRVPHPDFDQRMAPSDIDKILSDNKFHLVEVLFKDSYAVRSEQGQGTIRGSADNRGIVALNDPAGAATAALDNVLAKYKVASIEPLYSRVKNMTEAQLTAEQSGILSRMGISMPNRASYIVIGLSDLHSRQCKRAYQ